MIDFTLGDRVRADRRIDRRDVILDLLRRERQDLNERLRAINYDPTMGIIEKSLERRAVRARLTEIDDEEAQL